MSFLITSNLPSAGITGLIKVSRIPKMLSDDFGELDPLGNREIRS